MANRIELQYTGRTWTDSENKTFFIYVLTKGDIDSYKEWRDSKGWKTNMDTKSGLVSMFYPMFAGNRAHLYQNSQGDFGMEMLWKRDIENKARALYPTYNKVGDALKQALASQESYIERKTEEHWHAYPAFDYSKCTEVVEDEVSEDSDLANG
jgi:hypothetical protein